MDYSLGYREVIPDQTASEKWTEFTLNTGGTQSTLQDIKVTEKSGGYSYKNQSKYYTRNRFIYWRISHDVLELVEQSLDVNLIGNRIRYKFVNTPVLDGITIHEVFNSVIILVATVSSVHKLSFPHPDTTYNQEYVFPRVGVEFSAKSIFAEVTSADAKNPASFQIINNTSSVADAPFPHTSATGLSNVQDHFFFALAYSTGTVLLIKLNAITGNSVSVELKQHYDNLIIPKFISRALRGKINRDEVTVSMLFQDIGSETYLFCLCQDGNIRMWSTTKKHCSIITNFTTTGNQGTQDHILKKAEGPNQQFIIANLLCFATHSVVQVLKPNFDTGSFHLDPVISTYTPKDQDIVDFAVTFSEDIWAVFRSPTGETTVSYYKDNNWISCILENSLDSFEIPIDYEIEAKQNYIDFIFHPGRFPVAVINKALSIYRKSNIITDTGLPTHVLKERVCAVIDAQVNSELEDRDYSEEEVVDLINNCWQKFYSCCVEYYESGTRPIGLLILAPQIPLKSAGDETFSKQKNSMDMDQENDTESNGSQNGSKCDLGGEVVTSGVVIIKKLYVSLIRPMDALEAITLNAGVTTEDLENEIELFGNGIAKNLLKLIKVLLYLDDNISYPMKMSFDKNLRHLKSPITAANEIFGSDLKMHEDDTLSNLDLLYNVAVNIDQIEDLESLITLLLDLLDVGQPDLPDAYEKIENTKWLIYLGHLYGSNFATSFVVNSLQQMIGVRYELCRCLFMFQHLLVLNAFQFVDLQKLTNLEHLVERTSVLTQCYFILMWMANTPIHAPQFIDSLESCASALNLVRSSKNFWIHSSSSLQSNKNITILELFLQSTGSTLIRLLLSKREIPQSLICLWHHSLLPYMHILSQLIWPICNNKIFPEFLLTSFQYLHMQEYTRLLSKWCHANSYTRKFLLACALLDSGEHFKAFDIFNKAAHGVGVDDFIKDKVIQTNESLSRERLMVMYYLKVIKLFEQQNQYDLIISLAEHAIEISQKDDPELPTLYSIVFLNHLHIGQYKEAYNSLMANPDDDRKKDCLRQLVVSLFDSRLLDTLMNFSFAGMQDDLERIIEGRARSLDVMNNEYYNFLYSFHTLKGSMRKAACVMYEQAFRLSVDNNDADVKVLEKQCICYTATINCLNLVKQEDAWIVKPFLNEEMDVVPNTSPKLDLSRHLKKQVEVLELADVIKEYSLCKARLRLLKFSPQHLNKMSSMLSAYEIIGILTNVGFYKDALQICKIFNILPQMVLSGLASNCVRLDETQTNSAWEWLTENDISDLGDGTASNLAWRLLESFLKKYEEAHSSSLHRAVTVKLLQLGVFLPHWLVASYKKKNPSELLRLLLENGRLEESALLAIEYSKAVLGQGKDHFNLTSSMLPQNPTSWLPLNIFDLILMELETHSKFDKEYKELHEELSQVLEKYYSTAASVSEDKIKLLRKEMSSRQIA